MSKRKSHAEVDLSVQKAEDTRAKAIVAYEKVLRAKRQTEALIVEVYRTTEASRRQGAL